MTIAGWPNQRVLLTAICTMILIFALAAVPGFASAAGSGTDGADTRTAVSYAGTVIDSLKAGNADQAAQSFSSLKAWWNANKKTVKQNSLDMSLEIDRQIANLSLDFLNRDTGKAADDAEALRFSLQAYADGAYTGNDGKQKMTLSSYVMKLRQAADKMQNGDWDAAQSEVKLLQRQWLSVEGDVVSRSQTAYNNAERDLVLMDAYLASPAKRSQALPVAERMTESLSALLNAGYSWWDAALIPLREGIEALLVVGTLLMFARKSDSRAAKRWVVGGSAAGILLCVAVGFAVAMLLSAGTFGQSNSLINGWTGVLASLLLLYVSYWLHRNADIKRWNQFLKSKSVQAMTSGRMVSLGLLAFFAIVREGFETVIFLIGMAGKMPAGELAGGIAAGFGILAVVAFAMIKLGTRLPVRPVFLVSSAVVFYLCFKFMGSGIHSLQMAGIIPSAVHDYLPEWSALSLYPSWYSTLPQALFAAAAATVLIYQRISAGNKRKRQSEPSMELLATKTQVR
ncbi:FTR1 family iron permease [Cohnella caldifontis]|uniref:FTR1 family iron permease n=1 Tax=Cohnella caldifontis TaxID=3027471 RepID=UPI0023EDAD6A|nr:FTR1 family protein [Cohnella sp. YIM B05605]